jgi:hypothetical protein
MGFSLTECQRGSLRFWLRCLLRAYFLSASKHRFEARHASTLATDKGRIERHIKPLIGRETVQDVSRADVKRCLQDIAQGKTAADVKTGKRGRAIVRGG